MAKPPPLVSPAPSFPETGQESASLYALLFSHAYDPQYVLDPEANRFLLVNDAFLRLTGYTREELTSPKMQAFSLIAPEDRDRAGAQPQGSDETTNAAYTLRILRKDGTRRELDLSVHRLTVGGRLLTLGSARDATDRNLRLAEVQQRAERSLAQQSALLSLQRASESEQEETDAAFRKVTETSSRILGTQRASLWMLSEDGRELVCRDQYLLATSTHESGTRLKALEYPRYFQTVSSSRVLAADDAVTDPRTSEFAQTYLKPLGISSMLDVGIHLHGRLAGVLCHEQTGPARVWTPEEQAFASSVADRVSLLLEAGQRRLAERRFRIIFEQSSMGMAMVSLDHRFQDVNPTLCSILGYPRQELIGKAFEEITHPDHAVEDREGARRLTGGEIPAYRTEKRYLRRDGSVVWVSLTATLLKDGSGPIGFLSTMENISERKAAETRLKESEERFRQLFEATTEGILVHTDGIILFANRNLSTILGVDPAELVGRGVMDFVAPDSRDLVSQKIRESNEQPYEFLGLRKDGSTVPLRSSGKDMPFEGRLVRVAALRDLTERKQMEASLERQVRLEKKKTMEAFQANVRIFHLTEKVRAAYQSISQLAQSRKPEELLGAAVRLLCDPAGLDYREAAIWVSREGALELAAAHPERDLRQSERISVGTDHPVARTLRGEPEAAPDPGGLLLPLKGQSGTAAVLEVRFHNAEDARSWQENILRTLANALALMFDNLNLYEMVRRQSITDALTEVHNRRHFDEKLAVETERAVRYKRDMALVLLDLDNFKRINDDPRYGHPQGDSVLRELGALLRKQSRQIDIVCRYGGEEFGLILPETSLENATRHAERLRVALEAKTFSNLREPLKPLTVTASFGVSAVDPGHATPAAVLQAADQACYTAKRAGKNRVAVHAQA